jgi:hypothetical protein
MKKQTLGEALDELAVANGRLKRELAIQFRDNFSKVLWCLIAFEVVMLTTALLMKWRVW